MARVIKCTACISTIAAILCVLLYGRFGSDIFLTLAITCGTIAYHFIMRLLVGVVVGFIMDGQSETVYKRKWFQPRKFESRLYAWLKVKRWKGKMPTYAPSNFSVEKHSLSEIVQAMCEAEVVHEVIMVCSFLPLAVIPIFGAFWVFLITSILAACFDMMFVIMQRYNRPRVVKVMEKRAKEVCQ